MRDRKGNRFLLQCAGLQKGVAPELLNPVALYLGDKKQELGCADFLWLHFTIESKSQCACVAREYAGQSRPSLREGAFTRGLYFKPIG